MCVGKREREGQTDVGAAVSWVAGMPVSPGDIAKGFDDEDLDFVGSRDCIVV